MRQSRHILLPLFFDSLFRVPDKALEVLLELLRQIAGVAGDEGMPLSLDGVQQLLAVSLVLKLT